MLKEFQKHITASYSNLKEQHFLLAISGGLDSVVLAHLCVKMNLDFSLAHCNFNLRGEESNADENSVRSLAKKHTKKIFVTNFETVSYMNTYKVSLQVAARELRYTWFAKIMKENSIPTLVTAHHADDNLETFLINLSRGTGIDGLTSIPAKTGNISRPLLPFSRAQILTYAEEHKLKWREDKSNQETKYLRNKIRHTIVPLLKELHPTFLANFLNTQSYLAQTNELVESHIENVKLSVFIKETGVIKIEIAALENLAPLETYIYHLFKPYGFIDAEAIMALFSAMSGKELFSSTHRLLKDRTYLLLQKTYSDTSEVYFIPEETTAIEHPIKLSLKKVDSLENTSSKTISLDKETLIFPLTVRRWKTGDYFHPFGMKGVKKLSKFFKDEKYSLIDKEEQWLLCSEDKIVWVIGKRADDRFKVTDETKNILKITHE